MINFSINTNSILFSSEDNGQNYKYISQYAIEIPGDEVIQGQISEQVFDFIIQYQDRLEYYIYLKRIIEKGWHVCFLGYQSYNIVEKLIFEKLNVKFTVLDIVDPNVCNLNYHYLDIFSYENENIYHNYDLIISYGMFGWLSKNKKPLSEFDISIMYFNIISLANSRILISIKDYDDFRQIEPFNGKCISKYSYFFQRDNEKLNNSLNMYRLY